MKTRFWSKLVEQLDPYIPGEQPQAGSMIKLNTNENPYPPAPAVAKVIEQFDSADLRRYPDPESRQLSAALASRFGLKPDQVFVGNGSDEVLAHCFQALLKHDLPILFPDISYSFYPVYCALYQIEFRPVALRDDFTIDIDDYASANGGIILPNPNAPTGIALEISDIRRLLETNRQSVVVIDEAYVDFGADSASELIAEFDNLLVVQTFSKSRSLAGARIGYALGQDHLIEALQRVKNSFNSYPVDSLTSRIALAALADDAYFEETRQRVIADREWLCQQLQSLSFNIYPSSSNFVLVQPARKSAESIYLALKQKAILVRYFKQARIDNCLRITIGTREECEALIAALVEILN